MARLWGQRRGGDPGGGQGRKREPSHGLAEQLSHFMCYCIHTEGMGLLSTSLAFSSTPSAAGWVYVLGLLCALGLLWWFATVVRADLRFRAGVPGAHEVQEYDLGFLEEMEGDPWPIYGAFPGRAAEGATPGTSRGFSPGRDS